MKVEDLVSVLMPTFNKKEFARDAVISLLMQDWPVKLIVVDDASTDGTREEIDRLHKLYKSEFKDFMRIYLPGNIGPNGAMEMGMLHLEGKASFVLDPDDFLHKDYIKTMYPVLMQNLWRGVGFAYSNSWLVDEYSNIIGQGNSRDFDSGEYHRKSYIPGNAMTLTKLLREVLPLDWSIRKHTKWHRIMRMIESYYQFGEFVPERLFYYRMHSNNVSGVGDKVNKRLSEGVTEHLLDSYWEVTPDYNKNFVHLLRPTGS